MTDFDDNQFDQFDEFDEQPAASQKPGNRNFLIAIGILGAVFLVIVIALIAYLAVFQPQRSAARLQQAATAVAESTAIAQVATDRAVGETKAALEAQKAAITATSAPSPTKAMPKPTNTVLDLPTLTQPAAPTHTQVIAMPSNTPLPMATSTMSSALILSTDEARLATLTALFGQKTAESQATQGAAGPVVHSEAMTSTAKVLGVLKATSRPTALPHTGFADEVGLPVLFGSAALLVAIIFLARRLRYSR